MRTLLALSTAILIAGSSLASAMTDAECTGAWTAADTDKDGFITEQEAARYHATYRNSGKIIPDGKLSQAMFMEQCKAGLFAMRQNDPGAPLKGANSFTENQAKDRAIAHGLTNVSTLAKDADGIWRGTAMASGKQVKVGIDYKGNIVTE